MSEDYINMFPDELMTTDAMRQFHEGSLNLKDAAKFNVQMGILENVKALLNCFNIFGPAIANIKGQIDVHLADEKMDLMYDLFDIFKSNTIVGAIQLYAKALGRILDGMVKIVAFANWVMGGFKKEDWAILEQ